MVEHLLPKQRVASSSLVSRSIYHSSPSDSSISNSSLSSRVLDTSHLRYPPIDILGRNSLLFIFGKEDYYGFGNPSSLSDKIVKKPQSG